MAAHRAIPRAFARVHPRFQTPTWSTIGMGLASIAFYAVLPLAGGLILWAFFGYACHIYWSPDYGSTYWTMPFSPHWVIGGVFLTGIGALVLGIPLMLIYRVARPDFFRGRVIPKSNAVTDAVGSAREAVPAGEAAAER